MNVQTLYETLTVVEETDKTLDLQNKLIAIASNLESLVQSPAQPQVQSSLAAALEEFSRATNELRKGLTPSRMALIKSIGGQDSFDPVLSEKIRRAIAENAMTPSVASDFVKQIVSSRNGFLKYVRSTREGIERLGLHKSDPSSPAPASAELGFLIPRTLFKNELGAFSKELHFINRMLMDLGEAVSGERKPVGVESLSTSDPMVFLAAGLGATLALGKIVEKFLDVWKKAEEIREIRARLRQVGMGSTAAVNELEQKIEETIEEAAETVSQGNNGHIADAGHCS